MASKGHLWALICLNDRASIHRRFEALGNLGRQDLTMLSPICVRLAMLARAGLPDLFTPLYLAHLLRLSRPCSNTLEQSFIHELMLSPLCSCHFPFLVMCLRSDFLESLWLK